MCRNACGSCGMGRREFLFAAGAAAAGFGGFDARRLVAAETAATRPAGGKGVATVRVAFLYPPSEELRRQGYYSWPGSGFDAEGHHRQYADKLAAIGRDLGMKLAFEPKALTGKADADRFIAEVKADAPGGLLLIAFKKSEWEQIKRIIAETGVPTIAVATMGVLLMSHIQELRHKPGVHVISSLDNFDAMRDGLNLIRTARWMRDATILSIAGGERGEYTVPLLGTRVRKVPMQRFIELYKSASLDAEIEKLLAERRDENGNRKPDGAKKDGGEVLMKELQEYASLHADVQKYLVEYRDEAKETREPSETEVVEAARAMVACERLVKEEGGEALMMACLEGIAKREIPPPCLAFMSLRDAGFVAGCQNDLDATLTMMLGQQLLGKPGFQHNPACDTEKDLYYCSHCTSPRRLSGAGGPARPFILRSHAEAGVGAVPQVLWPLGEDVTIAQYISDAKPRMLVYSGKTVEQYDTPPAGGCRTNVVAKVDGIASCDITPEHMLHPSLFLGNHVEQLRAFCRLYSVELKS